MDDVPIQLGARIRCADGERLNLADVVIEPRERRLTHLVVDTDDGQTRLVPIDLLASDETRRQEIVLTCTATEVRAFDPVRHIAYLGVDAYPDLEGRTDIGTQETFVLPSPGSVEFAGYAGEADATIGMAYDRIPSGEAELRRASTVVSADGEEVGHVDGFHVSNGKVTHVVIARGHLWGTRAVSVPIDAVDTIATDRITVHVSKDELAEFPSVRALRPFS